MRRNRPEGSFHLLENMVDVSPVGFRGKLSRLEICHFSHKKAHGRQCTMAGGGGLLDGRWSRHHGRGPKVVVGASLFWGEGSPTKIDYRKKVGTLIPTSTGGPSQRGDRVLRKRLVRLVK